MGCEHSNLNNKPEDTDSDSSHFQVGHKSLVWKDRGEVF